MNAEALDTVEKALRHLALMVHTPDMTVRGVSVRVQDARGNRWEVVLDHNADLTCRSY